MGISTRWTSSCCRSSRAAASSMRAVSVQRFCGVRASVAIRLGHDDRGRAGELHNEVDMSGLFRRDGGGDHQTRCAYGLEESRHGARTPRVDACVVQGRSRDHTQALSIRRDSATLDGSPQSGSRVVEVLRETVREAAVKLTVDPAFRPHPRPLACWGSALKGSEVAHPWRVRGHWRDLDARPRHVTGKVLGGAVVGGGDHNHSRAWHRRASDAQCGVRPIVIVTHKERFGRQPVPCKG